jgi:hypothetical protein
MQRPSPESTVTTHTHQTAPTQFVEANGIRFAYRRQHSLGWKKVNSSQSSSAPDNRAWDTFESASNALAPNLSREAPAARYSVSRGAA